MNNAQKKVVTKFLDWYAEVVPMPGDILTDKDELILDNLYKIFVEGDEDEESTEVVFG